MQGSGYSYATHWLIAVYCFNKNGLRILTFLSLVSSDGSSPTISPVRIFDYGRLACKATVFKAKAKIFWALGSSLVTEQKQTACLEH